MSAHPVQLQTAYGLEQFNILAAQRAAYHKLGQRSEFRARCREDLVVQSTYLTYFLDDEIMEAQYKLNENDVDNFKIFNQQSDVVSCLNYFSKEWV